MRIPRFFVPALLAFGLACNPANAQQQPTALPSQPPADRGAGFSPGELVDAGHTFFGTVSRGLATVIEKATGQWGQPNGYILGQEGGGAFVAGLRYGEGTLFTRNAGDMRVYWQG